MDSSGAHQTGTDGGREHAAGAYDVRNVIAGLGQELDALGPHVEVPAVDLHQLLHLSAAEQAKTGGVDANLWTGIAMLVFAAAFALWSRLRPVVVDPGADVTGDEDRPPAH